MRSSAAVLCAQLLLVFSVGSTRAQSGGGTWQRLAPMPIARQEVAAAVLNGKVYVLGGLQGNGAATAAVEAYNPHTNTWAAARSLPFPNHHNSAAVAAGRLYSFGGVSSATFVYDPDADTWSPVAPMEFLHGGTAAVGVIEDKIYVAGGTHGSSSISALEVYDPATNTWTRRASMSVARDHCAGAVIDGKFYVVAGRGSAGAGTALEVYDPVANNWSMRARMPTFRSGAAAAAVNGELWVFGGETPGIRPEVEAYNSATNTWRRLADMPTPRHGISAGVIGNRVYLAGGGTVEGLGATEITDVFTVDRKAVFANISSRAAVETGDDVPIGGFIVTGKTSKRIVVRAVGPSTGVPGALADPFLELYDGEGRLIASNDNWQDAPNKQEISETTLAPGSSEAAILRRLEPGDYTAIVRGKAETTGVGLVEIYDMEAGAESKLANISTRAFVQTSDDVLIGGLILTGSDPIRVLLRAIGPSLPVPGALQNPTLELRDANGALRAENDDWRSTQESEIIGTGAPPANDRESAIVQTLAAAPYTAIVRGVAATTGVALVEAYALE